MDDPDILAEAASLTNESIGQVPDLVSGSGVVVAEIPLKVIGNTHEKSPQTAALLEEVGGSKRLIQMAKGFYEKVKKNVHLDQFLRNHADPHGDRLGLWIAEKSKSPI